LIRFTYDGVRVRPDQTPDEVSLDLWLRGLECLDQALFHSFQWRTRIWLIFIFNR